MHLSPLSIHIFIHSFIHLSTFASLDHGRDKPYLNPRMFHKCHIKMSVKIFFRFNNIGSAKDPIVLNWVPSAEVDPKY